MPESIRWSAGSLNVNQAHARGSSAAAETVRRLRERASRHHRSLQGELLAILEGCVRAEERLTRDDLLAETRLIELHTPSESTAMLRADRECPLIKVVDASAIAFLVFGESEAGEVVTPAAGCQARRPGPLVLRDRKRVPQKAVATPPAASVALESILGFSVADGRTLVLEPRIPASWPGFTLRYRLTDRVTCYHITVVN